MVVRPEAAGRGRDPCLRGPCPGVHRHHLWVPKDRVPAWVWVRVHPVTIIRFIPPVFDREVREFGPRASLMRIYERRIKPPRIPEEALVLFPVELLVGFLETKMALTKKTSAPQNAG